MSFKKSLQFFNQFIKNSSDDKLFLCRSELLFRHHIVPNISIKKIDYKIDTKTSIILYLSYVFLALISIINIIKLKIFKKKYAQYLIDINNSDGNYDFRAKEILGLISPKESVNFMHINSVKYSLKTWYKKDNLVYFEAIYYVLKPFLRKKRYIFKNPENTFANELLEIHQSYYNDSYYIYKIVKWILKFLQIKKLICLDDSRYINELNIAGKELAIETFAYMHGRFNEYHVALFEHPFDKYFVWNKYFKNKLLNKSSKYKSDNIVVIGHMRLKERLKIVNRKENILWLGESNIDYNEVIPYVQSIINKGINVIYRGKPGAKSELDKFLRGNKITIDNSSTFFDSLTKHNITLVIGTHSTALLESWIVNVPSLVLKCSYDYGSHLWEDKIVEICDNPNNINKKIEEYFDEKIITKDNILNKKNEIWNTNYTYDKDTIMNNLGLNR